MLTNANLASIPWRRLILEAWFILLLVGLGFALMGNFRSPQWNLYTKNRTQIDNLEVRNAELEASVSTLAGSVAEPKIKHLGFRNAELEASVGALEARNAGLEATVKRSEVRNAELEFRIAELKCQQAVDLPSAEYEIHSLSSLSCTIVSDGSIRVVDYHDPS